MSNGCCHKGFSCALCDSFLSPCRCGPRQSHASANAAWDSDSCHRQGALLGKVTLPKAVLYAAHVASPCKATKHQPDVKPPLLNGTSALDIEEVQLPQEQARNPKQPHLANLWFLKTPSTAPQSETTTPGKVQSCLSCFCSKSGLAHVGKPFTAL